MKRTKLFFWIIAVAFVGAANVLADVKIKTRNTVAGQTTESTVYIKGKRQRSEQDFGGFKTVQLTQCDLRRDVQLNAQAKTFFVSLYEGGGSSSSSTVQNGENKIQNPKSKIQNEKGVVTTIVTLKDTGERKQMFGYTARRILSTLVTESSPDACSPVKTKMETDGWYIDAEFAFDCLLDRQHQPEAAGGGNEGCRDRQVFRQNGAGKLGYPVYLKTTMSGDENGGEDFASIQEVVEISPAALDAALFEIPANYREVKNRVDLFKGGFDDTDDGDDEDGGDEGENPKSQNTSVNVKPARAKTGSGQTANAAPQKLSNPPPPPTPSSGANMIQASQNGVKKAGVVRLGVVVPVKTETVGEGMDAGELSAAVGNSLAEYLKGANVELVRIEARLPRQIKAEAGEKSCDFVIYATVSHKKGGGGGFGKMFGKIAPAIADAIPGSERSVEANTAINAGRGVLYAAGRAAENVKAKDELTLDVRMEVTDASVLKKQFKTKAKADGEDIISPLVEQAAQAVLGAAAAAVVK